MTKGISKTCQLERKSNHRVATRPGNQKALERPFKIHEGPVELIKQVEVAHSFLQPVSNQFHVIILSLPM